MTAIKFGLFVDASNQWFVSIWLSLHGRKAEVNFKVDNGCNGLVLSRKTLKALNYSIDNENIAKLQDVTGRLASGEKSSFKNLGTASLYTDKKQLIHICNANAICHATRETNDLMGTEVFKQFTDINLHLSDDKYMELLK